MAYIEDQKREQDARYYQLNKDKIVQRARRYYAENKEKVLARLARVRKRDAEKIKARKARDYARDREKVQAQHKAYREANREKVLAQKARYRESNPEAVRKTRIARKANGKAKAYYDRCAANPLGRLRMLLWTARFRAPARGLSFDNQLFKKFGEKPPISCACCGARLDYSVNRGRRDRWRSPSFDRLDNSLGYTIANTRLICWRCNGLKRDGTLAELEAIVAYIRRAGSPLLPHSNEGEST